MDPLCAALEKNLRIRTVRAIDRLLQIGSDNLSRRSPSQADFGGGHDQGAVNWPALLRSSKPAYAARGIRPSMPTPELCRVAYIQITINVGENRYARHSSGVGIDLQVKRGRSEGLFHRRDLLRGLIDLPGFSARTGGYYKECFLGEETQ
jgi:hypothetical protein